MRKHGHRAHSPCLQSVIHMSLEERHKVLGAMVAECPPGGTKLGSGSVVGRVYPLDPGRAFLNGMKVSRKCTGMQDVQEAFEDALKGEVSLSTSFVAALPGNFSWQPRQWVTA